MKIRNSKIILAICIFFSCTLTKSYASHTLKCEALVRDHNHQLKTQLVELKDITIQNKFEGRYFKIVEKKNSEAISTDSALAMRACHVYYHLTQAREYFLQNFEIPQVETQRQLIIRLEMEQGFSDAGHFLHENHGKYYNNAITIPPAGRQRLQTISPWYYEIWFAPKKEVKVKSSIQTAAEIASSAPVMTSLLTGVIEGQATMIGQFFAQGGMYTSIEGKYFINSLLMSVAVTALVPNIIKLASPLIKKEIFLDSAMIPEVIYHEYSHFALSHHIKLDAHSAVSEGIANFYAAMIGKTDAILKKSRKFAKGLSIVSARDNKNYEYFMEDQRYAQHDFTFKYLYGIKTDFGQPMAEQLIFQASRELKQRTPSLKKDLIPAIFKAQQLQNDPSAFYRLHALTQKYGF